ncbi:uncharacterized protein PAF06_000455 [Gastrophryne carolinensis]
MKKYKRYMSSNPNSPIKCAPVMLKMTNDNGQHRYFQFSSYCSSILNMIISHLSVRAVPNIPLNNSVILSPANPLQGWNMSLNGVSLPSTPIVTWANCSTPKRRCSITPLCLPAVPTASHVTSMFPPRLNPLHPPGVKRRTVSLETLAAHQHNHQRVLNMQQKEYSRFHQGWRRPFYGTPAEKEEYRKEIRHLLKKQMSDKWALERETLASRSKEVEVLMEVDRLAISQDLEQERAHALFLRRYRDENKRLMENRWQENRLTRSLETLKERELLQYNPINWNGTLK